MFLHSLEAFKVFFVGVYHPLRVVNSAGYVNRYIVRSLQVGVLFVGKAV